MIEEILKDKLSKEQIDQIKEAISNAELIHVKRSVYEHLVEQHDILLQRVIRLEKELQFRSAVG